MRGCGDYLVCQGLWKLNRLRELNPPRETNPLRWIKGPKVFPYSRLPKRIESRADGSDGQEAATPLIITARICGDTSYDAVCRSSPWRVGERTSTHFSRASDNLGAYQPVRIHDRPPVIREAERVGILPNRREQLRRWLLRLRALPPPPSPEPSSARSLRGAA